MGKRDTKIVGPFRIGVTRFTPSAFDTTTGRDEATRCDPLTRQHDQRPTQIDEHVIESPLVGCVRVFERQTATVVSIAKERTRGR